ncbi:MAG: TonB-dependent receptor [Cytophagales bacterium]|nr:TonB-dependent receptor [Cytophagales bacterium]
MKYKLLKGIIVMTKYAFYTLFTMMLCFSTMLASETRAQKPKSVQEVIVDVHFKNATLQEAFQQIERKTSYRFMYDMNDINTQVRLNFRAKKVSLYQILERLSKEAMIRFKQTNFDIDVRKISEQDKKISTIEVQLQAITIVGKVTEIDSGEELPGVNVLIKGTGQGTVTDVEGNYKLDIPDESSILVFSSVGFVSEEIAVGNHTVIDIEMVPDLTALEEIVVVGYGTQKKSDLTGAVSIVKSEDIVKVGVTSVGHAIAGKAAGLIVTQNSAQPGGGLSWQIRGSATGRSPLVIVDGFPITGKGEPGSGNRYNSGSKAITLNTINPNDIESIEILKDASATAIYGARAAGGVVIITTKRGSEGKVSVDYRGSYSTQKIYNLPEMLSPRDFMVERNKVRKELFMYDKNVVPYGSIEWDDVSDQFIPSYTEDEINNFTGGTDWLDNVIRTGAIKQHNATITSGTKKTKYLISLSAYNQDGIVKTNDFKRFTGRINIDQELNDWINVGVSSAFSQIDENNVPLGSDQNQGSGIIRSALQFNPTLDIKDKNGNYVLDPGQSFIPNPVSLLENEDKTKNEDLFINSYLEFKPIEDLSVKLSGGMNRNWGWRNTFLPTSTLYGQREGGAASRSYAGKNDYLVNIVAQYNKTINDHSFSLMGGYEYQKFVWEGFNVGNNKFPYDGVKWYNLALGEKERPNVGSYGGSSELASYITRLNYSYKDKYLLTANLRVDGSSNFAENNQWGVFPGVAVAWRITEELFMQDIDWLSNLKLRVGYGQTGNDNLTGVLTYYTPGWNYAFGSLSRSGIGLANIGNPDLKWETQTDLNVGVDFGFFNNRISGTVEFYDRVISDLLGNKPLLSYHAITSIRSNLDAEKQSRGIDFQLSTVNFVKKNFKWNTDMTLTYYRDRWRKRDASWKPDINSEEQEVWGAIWTYESDGLLGVDEEVDYLSGAFPGTIKVKDLNGYLTDENGERILDENGKPQYLGKPDGKIDRADAVKKGYNVPVIVGMNNFFEIGNFDFGMYIHAMFNRWAYNENRTYYGAESFRIKDGTNLIDEVKDRWTFENQAGTFPSVFQANSPYGHGDYFLEEAWFIRFKNITLGYTFPSEILPTGLERVRLFADFQNLLVITPYSGMDPETGGGVSYPNQRTITAGVEIKF